MRKKWIYSLLAMLACVLLVGACAPNDGENSTESSRIESPSSSGESDETPVVYYTVTFKQEGEKDVVLKVESGKGVAQESIPTPRAKFAHTVAWETVDLSNITQNTVVNAIATPKTYQITLVWNAPNGVTTTDVMQTTKITVRYNEKFILPTYGSVVSGGWKVDYWHTDEGDKVQSGSYAWANDMTLYAEWSYWVLAD